MVVMQVGGLVLTSYTGYRYVGLSARALFDLRLTVVVYRRLQQLSPRFFAGARTGDLLSRLNTDVSELQRTAGDLLLSLTQNVLGLLVALGLVLALAPALLVPALLVLPFAAMALTRLRTRVTDENRRLREAGASVGSALVESVLGMRQTVAFRQEKREADRFRGGERPLHRRPAQGAADDVRGVRDPRVPGLGRRRRGLPLRRATRSSRGTSPWAPWGRR